MGEIYLNEMIISRNKLNTYNLIVCDISKLRSYKKFLELVKKIKKKFLKSTKVGCKLIFVVSHYAFLSYLKTKETNLPKKFFLSKN